MLFACAILVPLVVSSTACALEPLMLIDEQGIPIPSMLLQRDTFDIQDQLHVRTLPISVEQLSAFRAAGIDPSWMTGRFELPSFDPTLRRVTQDDHPLTIESWARHHSNDASIRIDDSLRFRVGRTTSLRDGNIAGAKGGIGSSDSDHVASIAQSEGEYDLYDLSLEWGAVDTGDLEFSLLSGLKAIEANIAKRVTGPGGTSIDTEHRVTLMPMVGSGVRWQVSDDLSFTGSALTHPIDSGDALIDFNAATDLRITRNVGFVAGYRIIRSNFDVGDVNAELTQEGLFARLQIQF